jgi:nucleotide sugar dehydrogenase
MPFRPGPGVGGHCIPVDPAYLSHRVKAELGYAFRMVELAEEINKATPAYVASRAWKMLNRRKIAMNGATILIVGITYKPDVADCRESPAVPLATRLWEWEANVTYHDPYIESWLPHHGDGQRLRRVPNVYRAAEASDLVILLQPHSSYRLGELATCAPLLLDTRGALPIRDSVERL